MLCNVIDVNSTLTIKVIRNKLASFLNFENGSNRSGESNWDVLGSNGASHYKKSEPYLHWPLRWKGIFDKGGEYTFFSHWITINHVIYFKEESMKRYAQLALLAALVLSLAVLFTACSGGGSGSNGGGGVAITTLSTSTQGAQAASASVASAYNVLSSGVQLSSIAASGGGPAITPTTLNAFAGTSTQATALSKFAARLAPIAKRAQAMKTSAIGYPVTISCATGTVVPSGTSSTPDSMTIDADATYSTFTITYTQCADTSTYTLTNGAMTISGSANGGTFTLGSPFTMTDYTDATMTTAVDKFEAALTMSFSSTSTASGTTNTISAAGTFEHWDYVPNTHDKQTMTNLSISTVSTTTSIGSALYNVDTLSINGSESGTKYASATDSTVSYSENDSFGNFTVAYKTPAVLGTSNFDYLSINGVFTISTTPADQCIDGTFSIATNTDIQVDATTGMTTAGQLTINSNVVVTFDPIGGVSVSVNNGAAQSYTAADLNALCAL